MQILWVEILTTVVCQLSYAGIMFSQIPFLIWLWVSAGHKGHLMSDMEVKQQPYFLPELKDGARLQALWQMIHILADPLASLVGVMQCSHSSYLHKICSFSFSRAWCGCMCTSMLKDISFPLTPMILGLEVVRDRCRLQFVLQVPVNFVGLKFISIGSHLSLPSTSFSFPLHLPAWLIHTSVSTLAVELKACRDCTPSSYTCIQSSSCSKSLMFHCV